MINLDTMKLNQLADVIFCFGAVLGIVLFVILLINVISIKKELKSIKNKADYQNIIISKIYRMKHDEMLEQERK